jgi:hypothetical protein
VTNIPTMNRRSSFENQHTIAAPFERPVSSPEGLGSIIVNWLRNPSALLSEV